MACRIMLMVIALVPMLGGCAGLTMNDVSTDSSPPPEFHELRREELPLGADATRAMREAYPDLVPLQLDMPPDRAFELVVETARSMPRWDIALVDVAARRLEAVARTRLFRFKDDVVIEVRREARGASVHMRSRSRIGTGDLGANAARISRFLDRLSRSVLERLSAGEHA